MLYPFEVLPMNKELKNISRIDQEPKSEGKQGQHGWWVRFQKNGKKFQHFFNDTKYGGKESGLIAAQKFRDAVKLEYIEKEGTSPLNPSSTPTKRNKSGTVGVHRTSYTYHKRGKPYKAEVWQAHWPTGNGKFANTTFSIKKHGEQEAFNLALKARERGLKESSKNNLITYYSPENEHQKIWRYLDFTKFVSMLDTRSVYFPCASMFIDKFEGSYSQKNMEYRALLQKTHSREAIDMRQLRQEVGISCWHANDHESAAMWELYAKTNEAVCIQSTYDKLSIVLEDIAELGLVQYIDYQEDFIPEHDPYLAFLYKRKSFEHENEVRALIKSLPHKNVGAGLGVSVDIELLIENIYISPSAPKWFHELVANTVKRFGLQKSVKQSSLAEDPIY